MANFQLAPKLLVVNTPEDLKAIKIENDKTLRLAGFADLRVGTLTKFVASRHVPATKEVSTLTVTAAAAVEGELSIYAKIISNNLEAEFAKHDSRDYSKEIPFQVMVKTGDTAAVIAGKIAAAVSSYTSDTVSSSLFTAVQGTGGNTNKVTITCLVEGVCIKWRFEGTATDTVSVAHAVTTPGYEGRGNYANLKTLRLETDARVRPYSGTGDYDGGFNQLILKNGKYASLVVHFTVNRPDLSGGSTINQPVSTVSAVELVINENACADLIKDIATFVITDAAVPVKAFEGTAATSVADLATWKGTLWV